MTGVSLPAAAAPTTPARAKPTEHADKDAGRNASKDTGKNRAEQPAAAGQDDVSPAARLRFERGAEAFRAGRYREAADQFRQADRLQPSPELSYNAAKAYDLMGDHKNALSGYREFLRRLPTAANRAETEARIRELEDILRTEGVQQVTVLSQPQGATLLIDGEPRGVTPWTGELEPGTHHIHLRLRNHEDAETDFELDAARARDVTLTLREAVTGGAAAPTGAPTNGLAGTAAPAEALTPPPPEADATASGSTPRWWTWTLFGGAAAALAGSGILELARRSAEDEARSSDVQLDHQESFRNMENRQTWARVLMGAGLAMGAAGGVSLYFDLQPRSGDDEWAALSCVGSDCTVSVGGYW